MATLAQRNNNPGALRGADGRFRVFATVEEGFQALINDLLAKITGRTRTGLNGSSTLLDLFRVYAPTGDGANNPAVYASNVAARLGVSTSTRIGTLQGRVRELAQAIAIQEGFYAGRAVSNYSVNNPFPSALTLPDLGSTEGMSQALMVGLAALVLIVVLR